MEEYKTMTYVFEGGINQLEIPYENIERTRLGMTEPAQTEDSLLVKTVNASED